MIFENDAANGFLYIVLIFMMLCVAQQPELLTYWASLLGLCKPGVSAEGYHILVEQVLKKIPYSGGTGIQKPVRKHQWVTYLYSAKVGLDGN